MTWIKSFVLFTHESMAANLLHISKFRGRKQAELCLTRRAMRSFLFHQTQINKFYRCRASLSCMGFLFLWPPHLIPPVFPKLFSSSSLEALTCLSCAKDLWKLSREKLKPEETLLLLFLLLPSTPSKMPARALDEIQNLKFFCSWIPAAGKPEDERWEAPCPGHQPRGSSRSSGLAGPQWHSLCVREGDRLYQHSPVSTAGSALALPAWGWRRVMLGPATSKSLGA